MYTSRKPEEHEVQESGGKTVKVVLSAPRETPTQAKGNWQFWSKVVKKGGKSGHFTLKSSFSELSRLGLPDKQPTVRAGSHFY